MHINDYVKKTLIGKTVYVLDANKDNIFCGVVKDVDENYVHFYDRNYDIYDFNFHFSLEEFKDELFSNIECTVEIQSEREYEKLCPECSNNVNLEGYPDPNCTTYKGWGTIKKE